MERIGARRRPKAPLGLYHRFRFDTMTPTILTMRVNIKRVVSNDIETPPFHLFALEYVHIPGHL